MGVGAGLYMCDVVKKVYVRYLISWWVLVDVRVTTEDSYIVLDGGQHLSTEREIFPQSEL